MGRVTSNAVATKERPTSQVPNSDAAAAAYNSEPSSNLLVRNNSSDDVDERRRDSNGNGQSSSRSRDSAPAQQRTGTRQHQEAEATSKRRGLRSNTPRTSIPKQQVSSLAGESEGVSRSNHKRGLKRVSKKEVRSGPGEKLSLTSEGKADALSSEAPPREVTDYDTKIQAKNNKRGLSSRGASRNERQRGRKSLQQSPSTNRHSTEVGDNHPKTKEKWRLDEFVEIEPLVGTHQERFQDEEEDNGNDTDSSEEEEDAVEKALRIRNSQITADNQGTSPPPTTTVLHQRATASSSRPGAFPTGGTTTTTADHHQNMLHHHNGITTPLMLDEEMISQQQVVHLVEARLVDGDDDDDEEHSKTKENNKSPRKPRKRTLLVGLLIAALLAIALLIGLIIGLVVLNRRDGDAPPPATATAQPESPTVPIAVLPTTTLAPTGSGTTIAPSNNNLTLPSYTLAVLENDKSESSPQAMALSWLEEHPAYKSMPVWRKEQVFALATFAFALLERVVALEWLNYDTSECDWPMAHQSDSAPSNISSAKCNQDGALIKLDFGVAGNDKDDDDDERGRKLQQRNVQLQFGATLTGSIPPEIGLLTMLEMIDLSGQDVNGTVPLSLAQLTRLTSLDLSHNMLTGSIISELSQLSLLENLALSNCQFNGTMPEELGMLAQLTSLSLQGNILTGKLPTELGRLSKLEQLKLLGNSLTGPLPPEFFDMTALLHISLSWNRLAGSVLPDLGQLTRLTTLNMHNNLLTGKIPDELGLLTDLKRVQIQGNSLFGSIPETICDKVEKLLVDCNIVCTCAACLCHQPNASFPLPEYSLEAIKSDLSSPQSVALGWLEGHPDIDDMPTWRKEQLFALACFAFSTRSHTSALSWLDYNNPECEWAFPQDADGSYDNEGPNCLGGQYRFLQFQVGVTEVQRESQFDVLNGTIPPEISLLSMLEELSLKWEGPMAPMPSQLQELTRLTSLGFSQSAVTGSIIPELGHLTELTSLSFWNCSLSGTFPTQLGLLTKLTWLDLSKNNFSGPLPTELVQLNVLERIFLDRNQLSGTIPPEISDWTTSLVFLELSYNSLVGRIPPEIGHLTKLTSLGLTSNLLTGNIPKEIGGLTNMLGMGLGNNSLAGSIPESLCSAWGITVDCNIICPCSSCEPCLNPELYPPSASPTTQALSTFLDSLESPVEDITSPQFLAARWLVEEDDHDVDVTSPEALQRYAVAALYFATGGDNWKLCGKNSPSCGDVKWLTDTSECQWFGVDCDDGGTIIQLNFPATGNDLIGTLPAEMSLLTDLQRFLAPDNSLRGDLEVSLGGLTSLEILHLVSNRFSGSLPFGMLANNPGLMDVNLGDNQFSGRIFSDWIVTSSKLSSLHLWENQLTGPIPSAIGNLSELVELDLEGNELTGSIPDELFSLDLLAVLSLRENYGLDGRISPLIGQLTALVVLQLGMTGMGGPVPEEVYSLINLSELNLEEASFSGTISDSIRNLNATLMDLFLNDNQFAGSVPEAFDHLTSLETLQIQGNQFTGSISQAVCSERGLRFQQLATLIVDCVVECDCCDNCEE